MRSYGEFMSLFSKTVAERTKPGQRQDVEEQGAHSPPVQFPNPPSKATQGIITRERGHVDG